MAGDPCLQICVHYSTSKTTTSTLKSSHFTRTHFETATVDVPIYVYSGNNLLEMQTPSKKELKHLSRKTSINSLIFPTRKKERRGGVTLVSNTYKTDVDTLQATENITYY